ncbi:MEKHLA domain-containing protein [Paenibacillus eucommiae]|uniref:MEKHLA domain-containing protein n=1 Tax=Paenibacillus eucommiae TaxID=1355755 RepID=A0ABS4J351_9BACL|nr:MEKHLA domain-containing protein [Paenibacillus eucommiae]MBP1994228.1 hypothetical protein [Paenibacillus eucommiae]
MVQLTDEAAEAHARLLVNSYRRWVGQELIHLTPGLSLAEQIDESPVIVLSHGTEADPVLYYGNYAALKLWEMDWQQFTSTPSRLTAEPMEREDRVRFLAQVTQYGYVSNYTGIRISSTGRRFYIKQATVWNLVDEAGLYQGQAATFSQYEDL